MSTIQTINIKNASSSVNNIVLGADGSVTSQGTIAMATPFAMRNKIINGAMEIYQRATGTVNLISTATYFLDRWAGSNVSDGTINARQTTTRPSGFKNAMYIETQTADTSLAAGQYVAINQIIEGNNVVDFAFGLAGAQPITLSFWVRSSLTGTFGGSIRNGALDRSYPFTYTISSANTYEYKTITIPGDTTGTWATDNTSGLIVTFGLGVGSTFSGTANSWQAGNFLSATGTVSVIGTALANFYLTGVQLEIGSTATPFERRLFPQEFSMCQRYYATAAVGSSGARYSSVAGSWNGIDIFLPATMRVAPTISLSGLTYSNCSAAASGASTVSRFSINVTTSGAATYTLSGGNYAADAEF